MWKVREAISDLYMHKHMYMLTLNTHTHTNLENIILRLRANEVTQGED